MNNIINILKIHHSLHPFQYWIMKNLIQKYGDHIIGFFLHTIAHNYPNYPNKVTIRKYYDLIQNMPLFIPNEKIGNDFSKLLDRFPVTPYLDNRDSFIRWMHFIHNRINRILDKEELNLFEALEDYREKYKPPPIKISEKMNIKKEYIIASFTLLCLILIIYFYQ